MRVSAGAMAATLVIAGLAACTSSNSTPGTKANNIGDLQAQQQRLTLDGYNLVQTNPAYKYVPPKNPLELANLKERLARFSDPSKVGYMYVFIPGTNMVFFSTVKGKVSSMGSSMTSPVGIVKDQGSGNGGNLTVPMPGDDLSYGQEECEATGVFWFDAAGVLHETCSQTWQYLDAPLNLPSTVIQLAMPDGSKPSNTVRP